MICVRSRRGRKPILWLGLCCAIFGSATTAKADFISVTNLVTDDQTVNFAQSTDPFLKNAWGISYASAPGGPFWVSNNGTGVATLYRVSPTTDATTSAWRPASTRHNSATVRRWTGARRPYPPARA